MTLEEFHKILSKPNEECDGVELRLKQLWHNNNAKSIFYITGLDVSHLFSEPAIPSIQIRKHEIRYIYPELE
jgi:hypothetical protein